VSVPGQITLLLALTSHAFDVVPIDRMPEACQAVIEAAARLPLEVAARLETAPELSEQDRTAILAVAQRALSGMHAAAAPAGAS
jgi:F-type H+-transporting ATPase subunit alpha